jgi:cytosine/adenosine deaminase-related metal-dependent hydrolase
MEESIRHGTTTIFDVGNSGAAEQLRNTDQIRLLPHLELIGLDPNTGFARLRQALGKNPGADICAHAPYSCSPELIQSVIDICKQEQKPFTMHFAESKLESELYLNAQGKFRNWVDSFYPRHVFQEGRESCGSLFEELNIPSRSILAHGNLLTPDDIEKIAQSQCTVVHCPQSARWFGHPRLDVESCMKHGLPIALGTDSLASAESLSMWEQMRLMWENYPNLSCEALLSMATGTPGRSLAEFGEIGSIKVGASMDLLLLELDDAVNPTSGDWLRSGKFKIISQFVRGKGDLICQKSF